MTKVDDVEVMTTDLGKCIITSEWPVKIPFNFQKSKNFYKQNLKILLGDFNCHSKVGAVVKQIMMFMYWNPG